MFLISYGGSVGFLGLSREKVWENASVRNRMWGRGQIEACVVLKRPM